MGKTHAATTATSPSGLYVPREDPPPAVRARAESFLRESNNKRSSDHAHTQAMVISSAAGELTLGIGLGFVSVGLGILGLIIKSDCEELSCCYGLIWCKKKRRRTRRGSGDSASSDSSGDPPAPTSPPAGPVP